MFASPVTSSDVSMPNFARTEVMETKNEEHFSVNESTDRDDMNLRSDSEIQNINNMTLFNLT